MVDLNRRMVDMSLRHLSAEQIRQIHAITTAIIDQEDQDALLSSLPSTLRAQLPSGALKPSSRLFQTLNELNGISSLADGSVPLLEWLKNLCRLHEIRPEIKQIEALARQMEGRLDREAHVDAPPAPSTAMNPRLHQSAPSPPPAPSRWPHSPLVVEFHRSSSLASGRLFEKRLFQTLTGESAPAFRDLHIPFRRLVLLPADPLSGRREGVRRLTLVLASSDEPLGPDALSVLRARASAAEGMERVAVAWLDPSPYVPPGIPGIVSLPIDNGDAALCTTSLDATLLDLLCGWLSGPGDRPARRTLAISATDIYGHLIAQQILHWMQHHGVDANLLDDWGMQLDESVSTAAVIVLRTDGWGQAPRGERGVLHAKELGIPVVVVEALANGEERSFPYLGNTPTVRWVETATTGSSTRKDDDMPTTGAHASVARQAATIARAALQEALRVRLARYRVEGIGDQSVGTQALPRPPELLDAAHTSASFILYPDPPVGEHEIALFRRVRPDLCLLTPTQWQGRSSGAPPSPTRARKEGT